MANPTGHHSEIIVHPLSMDEALADWSIPDPTDPGNYVEILLSYIWDEGFQMIFDKAVR